MVPQFLFFILVVGIPAWLFNRWLGRRLNPRRSFSAFLLYMVITLAGTFAYTFLFVWLYLKWFPLSSS